MLESALRELSRHHDTLRLRYVRDKGQWRQSYSTADAAPPLTWMSLNHLEKAEQERSIATVAASTQQGLNLEAGPLWRTVYFSLGSGSPGRLLLVIHHLAVDGVSWRLLLEDLETAYRQLQGGREARLPPQTTSYKNWSERLSQFAGEISLREELSYWMENSDPQFLAEAGKPFAIETREQDTEGSAETLKVSLTAEETQALLQLVPAAYNTQINDVLMTALARAWNRWSGSRVLFTNLEGHGRENLFADVDFSRTVGWFTSIFPVRLELPGSSGIR